MPITDDFTGTNGTGLPAYSANWAYTHGSGTNLAISSNAFSINATGVNAACERTESSFPSDHYAQVTVTSVAADKTNGVAVRCQGAASGNYYRYIGNSTSSSLDEIAAGVSTALGSGGAFAATDVVRFTVSGTTLTPTIDGSTTGTPGAQTDATYSNGKPGVGGFRSAIGTVLCDSFECTDFVIPAPTITQHPGSQSVRVGDVAVFTVEATTSGGTLVYDWEVDDGGGFANASGTQTNSTYTTSVLTLSEDGDIYRCNVTDDNGTTVSASATLSVDALTYGTLGDFDPALRITAWF